MVTGSTSAAPAFFNSFSAVSKTAYAERFVRSIKSEGLDRMIPFGERHFRRTIAEYVEHYHRERSHQGIENELIDGATATTTQLGRIVGVSVSVGCSITTITRRDRRLGRSGGTLRDRESLRPESVTYVLGRNELSPI